MALINTACWLDSFQSHHAARSTSPKPCQSPLGSAFLQLTKNSAWILTSTQARPTNLSAAFPEPFAKFYFPHMKPSPEGGLSCMKKSCMRGHHWWLLRSNIRGTSLSPFSWGSLEASSTPFMKLTPSMVKKNEKGLNFTEQRCLFFIFLFFWKRSSVAPSLDGRGKKNKVAFLWSV